jgi:hypothetical protein
MAEMYGNAFAGVENNMLSTILFLSKIYDNYFSTVTVDERRQRRTKKIGWTTTGKSRDVMIDDFVMHFEEGTLKSLTVQSLKEMQTFVTKEGGKREHAVGKHDDMLIADMIAIQMIKYKDRSKNASAFSLVNLLDFNATIVLMQPTNTNGASAPAQPTAPQDNPLSFPKGCRQTTPNRLRTLRQALLRRALQGLRHQSREGFHREVQPAALHHGQLRRHYQPHHGRHAVRREDNLRLHRQGQPGVPGRPD